MSTQILRIYISNTDKFRHTPLYEAIIFAAKRYELNGATAFRGEMGFGSSSMIHSRKFWDVTEKLPMVVEVIDEKQKIDLLLSKIIPWFEKLRYGCLIVVEDVQVILSKMGEKK